MAVELPDFSRANCIGTDPEAFFAIAGLSTELMAAKRVCDACEIKSECAEWAILHESDGLWGGLMPQERQKIRRERGVELQQIHLAMTIGFLWGEQ